MMKRIPPDALMIFLAALEGMIGMGLVKWSSREAATGFAIVCMIGNIMLWRYLQRLHWPEG